MFKPFLCAALLSLVGFVDTGRAQWIDYDAMLRDRMNLLNGAVDGSVNKVQGIVADNMRDPRIQQAYQAHRLQGRQMTLEQFCYWYAATAGGTNVRGYVENENDINRKETDARKSYHHHVNKLWKDTCDERNDVNDQIAGGRGDILSGGTNYHNPYTGRNEYLPYNVPAGHTQPGYYGDPRTMTPNGTYQYGAPNGWNYDMIPVWER
jgi:hypothetical protein